LEREQIRERLFLPSFSLSTEKLQANTNSSLTNIFNVFQSKKNSSKKIHPKFCYEKFLRKFFAKKKIQKIHPKFCYEKFLRKFFSTSKIFFNQKKSKNDSKIFLSIKKNEKIKKAGLKINENHEKRIIMKKK